MILLTVDTSSESSAAIPTAVDLARRFELPLSVLLVVEGSLRHHFDQLSRARQIDADTVIEEYLATVADEIRSSGLSEVHTAYRHATDAGLAIVEAVSDPDVALVVMATHGRSGLSRLLAGSVTEHVIRHSPVPVVVVPVQRESKA